jgi:hypothetical protein
MCTGAPRAAMLLPVSLIVFFLDAKYKYEQHACLALLLY